MQEMNDKGLGHKFWAKWDKIIKQIETFLINAKKKVEDFISKILGAKK